MDIRKLQRVIVDALEDVKGAEIRVFNSTGLTQLFDRVIIASGTSNRQTRALAASVRDKVKNAGGQVLSIEGEETGEWVLVDLGDAIVHIMQPTIRTYYNLEELWGVKPVSMKAHDDGAPSGHRGGALAAPATKTSRTPSPAAARKAASKKPAVKTKSRIAPKTALKTTSKSTPKRAVKTASKTPRTPRRRTASE